MKTKIYILVAIATFICQQTFSQNKVGTLPGTAGVSPTGAATYTIPIWVSPGTNGMQPDLSIVYNSAGGNGPMGIGWGISGLSAITRTGKDYMHFGNDKSGVDLTASDRYTLDGNLMVVTNGGAYNAAGTVYGTEMETFSKIEAFGIIYPTPGLIIYANCPEYFKVYRKDGCVLEYGNTADSKIKVTGTNLPLKWQLNKITDANGNYMTYEYENNEEGYVKKINYTGSTTQPFTPYASVEFEYTDNFFPLRNIIYVGGKEIHIKRKLNTVKIKYSNATLYTYTFSYTGNYFQHLFKIDYTNANGESFNSTEIDWGAATSDFASQVSLTNIYSEHKWFKGDFNGDGISDLVTIIVKNGYGTNDQFWLYLFDKAGNATLTYQKYCDFDNLELNWVRVGDVNGDGKDEFIVDYMVAGGSKIVAYTYNGSSFVILTTYQLPQNQDFVMEAGDFNGDGKLDLFLVVRGSSNPPLPDWYLITYTNGGFTSFMEGSIFANNIPMYVGDFTGDGKSDVMLVYDDTGVDIYKCKIVDLIPLGYTVLYQSTNFPTPNHAIYPGDFNGDGKTDIITWDPATNSSSLNYFNGVNFELPIPLTFGYFTSNPQNDVEDNDMYVDDFNGDGKSDIMTIATNQTATTTTIWMHYFKGNNGNNQIEQYNTEVFTFPQVNTTSNCMTTGDFNGDGKADFFHHEFQSGNASNPHLAKLYTFHPNEKAHLAQSITNGLGKTDHFNYEPLTELAVNTTIGAYTKGSGAAFPVFDYQGALHVVNKTWETDAYNTELNKTYYYYAGAKMHKQGRGFLCFNSVTAQKTATSFATRNVYNYDTQYYYPYLTNSYYDHVGSPTVNLKNTSYTNSSVANAFGCYFNYPASQVSTDVETGVSITTNTAINANGNLLGKEIIGYTGATHDYTTHITNTYVSAGNTSNGTPNKLYESTTQQEVFQPYDMYTVYKKYTYDNGTGNTTSEEVTPNNNSSFTTTSDYIYGSTNKCGQPLEIKQNGKEYVGGSIQAMSTQLTTFTYDAKCRFKLETKDDINQILQCDFYPETGNLQSATRLDARSNRYYYDYFGRLIKITDVRGNDKNISYNWCSSPVGAVYNITTTKVDEPTMIVYYDAFGRELRSSTEKLQNATTLMTVAVDKTYETGTGRLQTQSLPFNVSGSPAQFTTYNYNVDNGKIDKIVTANGQTISYDYSVNLTKIQDINNIKTTTINSLGQLTNAGDGGESLNYSYYAHGKLREMWTDLCTVKMEYDDYSHQTLLDDPDAGKINYRYNSFGNLTWQTDANSNTFEMIYNSIGRLTQKLTNGGVGNMNGATTDYEYYPQNANPVAGNSDAAGKIKTIDKDDGDHHKIEYIYHALGDLNKYKQTETATGFSMTTAYDYSNTGKLTGLTFPNGYKLQYAYNGIGAMTTIQGVNGTNTVDIWSNPVENEFGQPVEYTLGLASNNLKAQFRYDNLHFPDNRTITNTGNVLWGEQYRFDAVTGNLQQRSTLAAGGGITLTEDFDYNDPKQQLTQVRNTLAQQVDITLGPEGKFLIKNDIGDYDYAGTQPHAVTKIDAANYAIQQPLSIAQQDIVYTPFNKATTITENNKELTITYGPDDERVHTKLIDNSSSSTIPLQEKYFAPNYEEYLTSTQLYFGKQVHYVYCPYGLAAVVEKENWLGVYKVYFTGTDYLGSIDYVMDYSGTKLSENSFDAWGRRRDLTSWAPYGNNNPAPTPLKFDRGYTGHEHLAEFDLINMNGRIYDPAIGKMLSPDIYNNMPTHAIGLNRYAYAANNPFKYTDPSGNILGEIIGIAATAVAVASSTASIAGIAGITTVSSVYSNPFTSASTSWLYGTIQNLDIKESDRRASNSWKIWGGLGITDNSKGHNSFGHNTGEIASRLTWQLPQTAVGYTTQQIMNTNGEVKSVGYFNGATVCDVNKIPFSEVTSGVTLGSFIIGENISIDPFEPGTAPGGISRGARLLRHEYGHYRQSQKNGPIYMSKYAFSSAINSGWTEVDANYRSDMYFKDTYGSQKVFFDYPNDYSQIDGNWWEFVGSLGSPSGSIIEGLLNLNFGQ